MKRTIRLALLALFSAAILSGCGGAKAPSGTVTITFTQEPDNLNPLYSSMFFSVILREFFLAGLWSFDNNNQPVPVLAKEVPTQANGGVSADGKTITVHLQDNLKWSDGVPLTSDDFVFTYQMVMSDKNKVQSRMPYDQYVSAVEAPDAQTVIIRFNEAYAPWLTTIFNNAGTYPNVLPKHILQPVFDEKGTIDEAEWNRKPTVGVGPFVFKEWESGSHIIFTPNPNWKTPPQVAQIFIRIVPDDAAQEAAIIAGDTDMGVFLSSDRIPEIEKNGNVKAQTVLSGYDEALFYNVNPKTAHPAMLDVNVRKAISMAIDRTTIVNDLLNPDVNPVSVTFWDATPPFADPSLKAYPFDPAQSKQLLDAAGWKDSNGDGVREKDGAKLELRYLTNERELRKNVQAVVQQQLSQVGISVQLQTISSDVFWNGYKDNGPQAIGAYDIAEYSNNPAFPDPEASIDWLCSQIASAENPEGLNWQGYCNPTLDKLLDEQAKTVDRQKRIQLYYQIEKILYDDVISLGMWKDPDIWSIHTRLKNVKLSGATPFWNCTDWTVESAS